MTRILFFLFAALSIAAPAYAGIDESINNFTAPIASFIGSVVFF